MMDRIDLNILGRLQHNADTPVSELAEQVGLTKNPCWRRVRQLTEAGVIKKTVALLDPEKLNVGVTVFVNIRTNDHSDRWLDKFSRTISAIPEVVEFYRMSGDVDYMLKIVVPDIAAYDAVYRRMITGIQINDVSSYFAMEEIKNTTALPLTYAG